MVNRNQAEKKQFKQRREGLMKKANDLRKLCAVQIAVFIEDGDDWFIYRSREGWPLRLEIEVRIPYKMT
jgi:SRF-type transcription factor (DNA-binding and dimerisation domain)